MPSHCTSLLSYYDDCDGDRCTNKTVSLSSFYSCTHHTYSTLSPFTISLHIAITADLLSISSKMEASYARIEQLTRRTWEEIMRGVNRQQGPSGVNGGKGYRTVGALPADVNTALREMYGYTLGSDCTSSHLPLPVPTV